MLHPPPPRPDDEPTTSEQTPKRPGRWSMPPIADAFKYPITALTIIAAAAMSFAWWSGRDIDPAYTDIRAWHGEPWRLFTSIFPHLDVIHLLFNVIWIWYFSTLSEAEFGRWATAGLILVLGVGSSAVEFVFSEGGVGLSGVGYGFFGLFFVLSRRDPRFASAVDDRTARLFVGWFVLCWILTYAGVWRIANAAHASGAVFGMMIGFAVSSAGWLRAAVGALTAAAFIGVLFGAPAMRSLASPSLAALDSGRLGYYYLEHGQNERAAEYLEEAVALDPKQSESWSNLGLARYRMEEYAEAEKAARKGLALRPTDAKLRRMVAEILAVRGALRQLVGANDEAIRIYREAVTIDESSALAWFNLGTAYQATGEFELARDAKRKAAAIEPNNPNYREARGALGP